ncbi:hypothetical protein NE237_008534 [Protea cynaroides]|uniref:Scarecrow-like protein 9 n=1 Tax=Protea cynaroides TaxID=273540 RepID=A0A9Q0KWX2_9MAGN|nr:hypothetical protein NE237_008534 [Protea cynaroides]
MSMDPCLSGLSAFLKGFRIDVEPDSFPEGIQNRQLAEYDCYPNLENGLNIGNGQLEKPFVDQNFMNPLMLPPNPNCCSVPAAPPSVVIPEEERPEDSDSFNVILNYISHILMEDDMDDKTCKFQESSSLQEAEKSFYEILGKKYPPSPSPHQLPFYFDHHAQSSSDHFTHTFSNGNYNGSFGSSKALDSNLISDLDEYNSTWTKAVSPDYSSVKSIVDGGCEFVKSPFRKLEDSDFFSENESVTQFRRGVEEASKFLPNPEKRGLLPRGGGSKGRKHLHGEDPELEGGRSNKQSAIYTEAAERTEMFDMVLLSHRGGKGKSTLSSLREFLQNEANKNRQPNGGKIRGKKQGSKKEVVDLRTLLVHCAEAVAADDRTNANELLKQIKQHATAYGDGNQRLAHYFAESIEARLDCTGSERYVGLSSLRRPAVEILRAYHLYLAVCPFKMLTNFFSNRTIFNVSEKSTRLHIIDFGILFGFQWPSLIQTLGSRPGGPPKLRITGIELPQQGFKPTARVEETGRRLADYARTFNVPFEYNAIAKKWETIQLEDLKIDSDEVLVVNCIYRFRCLFDETVDVESPRNVVLKLIRKMNPDVFIPGVLSGGYGAPFFVTRFKEALFHFSAIFDMFETNVPRGLKERMLLEREIFGREAMNVISCEGKERRERPETYKKWQHRIIKAGFKQLPLNPEIMKVVKHKMKSSYHKDFLIDEDGHWMLQGWKGRIVYALSSWIPV